MRQISTGIVAIAMSVSRTYILYDTACDLTQNSAIPVDTIGHIVSVIIGWYSDRNIAPMCVGFKTKRVLMRNFSLGFRLYNVALGVFSGLELRPTHDAEKP